MIFRNIFLHLIILYQSLNDMQRKLEELCQIETSLLLEAVNIDFLSREHQVGVTVHTMEAKSLIASVF